jgi:hypothetical protein
MFDDVNEAHDDHKHAPIADALGQHHPHQQQHHHHAAASSAGAAEDDDEKFLDAALTDLKKKDALGDGSKAYAVYIMLCSFDHFL